MERDVSKGDMDESMVYKEQERQIIRAEAMG